MTGRFYPDHVYSFMENFLRRQGWFPQGQEAQQAERILLQVHLATLPPCPEGSITVLELFEQRAALRARVAELEALCGQR